MNFNDYSKEELSGMLKCAIHANQIEKVKTIIFTIKAKPNYSGVFIFDSIVSRQVLDAEEWLKRQSNEQ